VHDLRYALLSGAVGAGDEDANIRPRHATGKLNDPLHRIRGENDVAEIVLFLPNRSRRRRCSSCSRWRSRVVSANSSRFNRRQQLVIVPGLAM